MKPKTAGQARSIIRSKIGKEENYSSAFTFDNKFDNPEKLPTFNRVQYEELINNLEETHRQITEAISDTYFSVNYLKITLS